MTPLHPLQGEENAFLEQLYDRTKGDLNTKVSLYDIGEAIHLDRSAAKHTAESLIGLGFAEIRTLSGAIGITEDGIEAATGLKGSNGATGSTGVILGSSRIPDEPTLKALGNVLDQIKHHLSTFGIDYEGLSELMADLKTIDAQLLSPKPKTAVIRACLNSIRELLKASGERDCLSAIDAFIGK